MKSHFLLISVYRFVLKESFSCDALRDSVPFLQFKNVKNTHGGVLLLVKLQAITYVTIISSNELPALSCKFVSSPHIS